MTTSSPLPVVGPDAWYEIVDGDHGRDVTLVTEPYVDRFIRCNIWHVRGRDADLLIDTGLGIVSLLESLPTLFRGRRTIAVATHYHYDHVGSLYEFDERWIHEEEADLVADGGAIGGRLRTTTFSEASLVALEEAGYPMPSDGELLAAVPAAGYDPDAYAVRGSVPTRVLAEGDVVDLGDRSFEVLHLPGHSPGSIGLWDAERGMLFSGDALYDGPLLDFGTDSDVSEYVRTMERLRVLPVERVHGGHDPSFGRERLIELCDSYLERRAR